MKRIKQGNKTIEKGIKVVVVATLLAMTTFMSMPQDKVIAAVSSTKRGIMLGAEVTTQLDPTINTDKAKDWKGNYLYWGNDSTKRWQILSGETAEFGAPGMLLLSGNLEKNYFDNTRNSKSNEYVGSDLETHIDGKYSSMLSDKEQAVTLNSSNAGGQKYVAFRNEYKEGVFNNKKWFAPTGHALFNTAYGFHGDSTVGGNQTIQTNMGVYYWLSSMLTTFSFLAGGVSASGNFHYFYVDSNNNAARALSKIDSKSSVFVSATGGKPESGVSSTLAPVSDSTSENWKMTLKDTGQNINVTKADRKSATKVEISYTKNAAGANVGAVIVDADNNIVSYGHIAGDTTTGTASVDLPVDFKTKGYQLKVFTEDCNENATDYASDLKAVTVPAWYTITYELDSGVNNDTNPLGFAEASNEITFEVPTKVGYTFDGWYDAKVGGNKVTSIAKGSTGDVTIYARYVINTYTVEFKDYNGTVVKSDKVDYNMATIAPVNPTREGYTFVGWDKTFDKVISDMVITAVYIKNAVPVEPVQPQEPTIVPTNPSKPSGGNGDTPSKPETGNNGGNGNQGSTVVNENNNPNTSTTTENKESGKVTKEEMIKRLKEILEKCSKGQSEEVKKGLKELYDKEVLKLATTNDESLEKEIERSMKKYIANQKEEEITKEESPMPLGYIAVGTVGIVAVGGMLLFFMKKRNREE